MSLLGSQILMWGGELIPACLFQMSLMFAAWFLGVVSNCPYDPLFRAGIHFQTLVGVMGSGLGRLLPPRSRTPASHTGSPGLSAHSLRRNMQPSKAVSREYCFLEM